VIFMIEDRTESRMFEQVVRDLVASGLGFRFKARGRSMLPTIGDGDILQVERVDTATIRVGDILLFKQGREFKAHRVIQRRRNVFVTRGDAGLEADTISGGEIVGKIVAKECAETGRRVVLQGIVPRLNHFSSELRRAISGRIRRSRILPGACVLITISLFLALLAVPLPAWSQLGGVALDNLNSRAFVAGGNSTTCPATPTGQTTTFVCSFNHTTNIGGANSNSLLVIGISLNIQANTDSSVTAITYNGIALTSAANANPGNTLRSQIYYLKNPPVGTFSIQATIHKTGGNGNAIGLEFGAMTVYRVDTSFSSLNVVTNSGTGTAATAPFTTASGIPGTNDGVVDVLAVTSGNPAPTVTANTSITAPLVFENQQWNGTSGTSGQDVEGTGSTAGGTGSALTMREGLSASIAWTIAAISIPTTNPTAVKTEAFVATHRTDGVLLSWKTSGEMHNLGFNIYRESGGEKLKLNPSLISGSALLMRETLEQHGAKTYGYIDRAPAGGELYWLEDVDLNGTRTMHGPVLADSNPGLPAAITPAITLHDLARPNLAQAITALHPDTAQPPVRQRVATPHVSASTRETGFQLASRSAVKIFVDHEGWYHLTQPQLVSAGLSPNAEARCLHLFAEGVEQPIRITGATRGFGSQAAIEFYGTAIDTPYSGERVYWLVANDQPAMRISTYAGASRDGSQPQSFTQTLELKPRTTYFAALLHDNTDNFFGPLVSPTSAVETLSVSNLAPGGGTFEIGLQGVTQGQQHDVTVTLNSATLGSINFSDQQDGTAKFEIPSGVLTNGTNTITLTAQQGDNDLSVLDYINVSFPHTFTAESDLLRFTAAAGETVTVGGFVHPPSRLIDITDAARPFEIKFRTTTGSGMYRLHANVPWTSAGMHELLAVSDAQLASPAAMTLHRPSNLHTAQTGAEVVMLSPPQFIDQLRPLAELRRAEAHQVAVVNITDVYDEFNFGERTPYAIRDFLRTAAAAWTNKPHYLMLAGDASVDPRGYLGFGFSDFVPTKIVITSELKTASDDWFSDFNNTGFATIATGRLPARTPAEMQTIVGKILNYANGQAGSWTNQSMMVADIDDSSANFSQAALSVQKMLPQAMNVTDVFAGILGPATAKQNLLAGINAGQLLVNYNGHGSVEIWGSGMFDDTDASSLTNGSKMSLLIAMNCLNGFFHDVYTQSLAEALMLAPNGGAVSVWASSGLTNAGPQFQMDQQLVKVLFSQSSVTVGDAVLSAKSGIADSDVRKTFILFGDPLMRLKQPESLLPIQSQSPVVPLRTDESDRDLRQLNREDRY
jgi:hypothetical protein